MASQRKFQTKRRITSILVLIGILIIFFTASVQRVWARPRTSAKPKHRKPTKRNPSPSPTVQSAVLCGQYKDLASCCGISSGLDTRTQACLNGQGATGCRWITPTNSCTTSFPYTSSCAGYTSGAIIQFTTTGDQKSITFWSTNQAFISQAIRLQSSGQTAIPVLHVKSGKGCDPNYKFQVDPQNQAFYSTLPSQCNADAFAEVGDLEDWFQGSGESYAWCPLDAYYWRVYTL